MFFLFADHTNITSRSSSIEIFQIDLTNVANWMCANKLTINTDKTTVISFNKIRSASNIDIKLVETVYKPEPSCNYLGVVLDSKLSFFHHIQKIKTKLGRHCGVISKMRHYVPKSILLKFYQSNIKPVIQYGILVYGGTSFSNLNQILILQRKIVRMIYFKNKCDSITEALIDNEILTVHELYIYDLVKSKYTSFVTHCCENNTKTNSLTNRGSKLLNLLNENNLLPQNIEKDD